MRVGRVGVNDIIVKLNDQFSDPKAGCQVNFSPHRNWKNVHTGPGSPFFHRGTGLVDQVGSYISFLETFQQI